MKHLIVYAHPNPQSFKHAFYTSVPSVDNETREQCLEEVKELVNRLF